VQQLILTLRGGKQIKTCSERREGGFTISGIKGGSRARNPTARAFDVLSATFFKPVIHMEDQYRGNITKILDHYGKNMTMVIRLLFAGLEKRDTHSQREKATMQVLGQQWFTEDPPLQYLHFRAQ